MSGLVYFSSVSENTRRFVGRLGLPAQRIPLRPHRDGMPRITGSYVLIVPAYGSDQGGAVPKQVIADEKIRLILRDKAVHSYYSGELYESARAGPPIGRGRPAGGP
ncbi:class Ib ribonucleoside-diphosphate reductase assembly flavoprotein NrdI [Streptomyces monomycini]|uniref:class Ib ribonucleoside-diphosphate reductase assembly flavoprotein NrdI n=1 Tax=Streptomyces monomycini TaxID=371720 RepID=UPI000995E5C5